MMKALTIILLAYYLLNVVSLLIVCKKKDFKEVKTYIMMIFAPITIFLAVLVETKLFKGLNDDQR